MPICLTVAGVDPSGGAGIVADIRTFTAFGCYATSVITSLTFQNTQGVYGSADQNAEVVRKQFRPIFDDLDVDAVKSGMLPTHAVIEVLSHEIRRSGVVNYVLDPVVRSTSGFDLINDDALETLVTELFPLSLIVTPNLAEAERITGISITSLERLRAAGMAMLDLGAKNVLIKGGHAVADNDSKFAIDRLFNADGETEFTAERIDSTSTHGTGCVLSSAITACIAKGEDLHHAIETAKKFVNDGIRTSPQIGKGNSPVNTIVQV